MIDRGALVLGPRDASTYRGPHRTPLDGFAFTGRKGKDLARRYASALIAGDGVIEDLDEAIALCHEARRLGFTDVDVVVFVVPQVPQVVRGLPVIEPPPADDLELLGWDVIEPIEPWHSPIAKSHSYVVNPWGLLLDRSSAESVATRTNEQTPGDVPYVAVQVWRVMETVS
jgi:hypothetical protein